nr:DUF1007 family protein [Aestuariivirga litoralis]
MKRVVLLLGFVLLQALPAAAHPHVWADMRSQLLISDDGMVTGVRVQWTTDKAYALDALDGFTPLADGTYSAEDMKKLTDENLDALKDYGYFIFFRFNGAPQKIGAPVEGAQTYDTTEKQLTLYFTVPLETSLDPRKGIIDLKVYDPEFYIDFEYIDDKPLLISKAIPPGCTAELLPIVGDAGLQQTKDMLATKDKSWKPENGEDFGSLFAQAAEVKCTP